MVLKVDRWNGWIFGLSSVKMERKDRLYWRHPKTKSPDETNRPNIDWIIKAQYASQLTTYFIERKHIQRKGYHRGNTFRWNGCHSWGSCGILNCRFYPLSCTCRLLFCTWTCKCTWTPLAHCSCCGASPPPSRQLPAQGHRRWWAASGHRRRTSFLQSIPRFCPS